MSGLVKFTMSRSKTSTRMTLDIIDTFLSCKYTITDNMQVNIIIEGVKLTVSIVL